MTPLRATPAWKALEGHYGEIASLHLRELFADDPSRGETLTAEPAGLYLDYSKHRVTRESRARSLTLPYSRGLLLALREACDQALKAEVPS
jgi:glucose-6-phosphate isomerase